MNPCHAIDSGWWQIEKIRRGTEGGRLVDNGIDATLPEPYWGKIISYRVKRSIKRMYMATQFVLGNSLQWVSQYRQNLPSDAPPARIF